MEPPPLPYLLHDDQGDPVYHQTDWYKHARYRYTTELHAARLEEHTAWFARAHPDSGPSTGDYFAEAVCAPPPQLHTDRS